jgi:hypothetical protein
MLKMDYDLIQIKCLCGLKASKASSLRRSYALDRNPPFEKSEPISEAPQQAETSRLG